MLLGVEGLNPIVVQPACGSPLRAKSSPSSNVPLRSEGTNIASYEVLEVTSPQVSQERMGPTMVQDLPRYHSLVNDFQGFADRYMVAGRLRGPGVPGGGYLLEMVIPLSGEEGDVLLGQMDRAESDDE